MKTNISNFKGKDNNQNRILYNKLMVFIKRIYNDCLKMIIKKNQDIYWYGYYLVKL